MTAIRVLDFSWHQAKKIRAGVYVVTADMEKARDAGAAAATVRSNYGETVDTTAVEHNRRVIAAGLPRAFYWYHLSRKGARRQAEIAALQAAPCAGIRGFVDLEESLHNDGAEPVFPAYSEPYFEHVNTALLRCDELTGVLTGIYSSQQWLDHHFTITQQRRWAEAGRLGWWAHWSAPGPGIPWVPLGWKSRALPWAMWQDRIGTWPGFEGAVDQSVLWPSLTVEQIFGGAVVIPPIGPPVVPPAGLTAAEQQVLDEVAGLLRFSADQTQALRAAADRLAEMGR